ncbi:unnamed protein product, partial [Ixodes persulcatus]
AKQKKALLLHCIGEEGYDVYASLAPLTATPPSATTAVTTTGQTGQSEAGSTSGSPDDYEKAKQLLHDDFMLRVNRDYEIFNFRKTTQQDGQTIDAFYTRLR